MGLLSKNRDFSLISRILNDNDRDAADELVTQYYKAVYKHIYIKLKDEELSMDLTQETFISALKGLGGFNIEKASFKTWLTRIADNKVTDYFRSRQYHESIVTQIMDDTIQEPADERAGTETSVLGKLSYEEMEKMYGHHQFGVGDKPKNWDLADWVLGKFPTDEYATLREANKKACEAVECILTDGIESGMNKYNG